MHSFSIVFFLWHKKENNILETPVLKKVRYAINSCFVVDRQYFSIDIFIPYIFWVVLLRPFKTLLGPIKFFYP